DHRVPAPLAEPWITGEDGPLLRPPAYHEASRRESQMAGEIVLDGKGLDDLLPALPLLLEQIKGVPSLRAPRRNDDAQPAAGFELAAEDARSPEILLEIEAPAAVPFVLEAVPPLGIGAEIGPRHLHEQLRNVRIGMKAQDVLLKRCLLLNLGIGGGQFVF